MQKLNQVLIAEPSKDEARRIGEGMHALAHEVVLVHRGSDAVARAKQLRPEMMLHSLELPDAEPVELLREIRKAGVGSFIVATYRELSVGRMKELGKFRIGEFAAHPLDLTSLFRFASVRFGRPFRRHTRHQVALAVNRIDGATVGTTLDISEGGMQVALARSVTPGVGQFWEIALPDGSESPLRVRCSVLGVDQIDGQQTAARIEFEKVVERDRKRLSEFLQLLSVA